LSNSNDVIVDSTKVSWKAARSEHPARIASWRAYDALARRDKARYVSLYAPDGVIHDPVGKTSFDPTGAGHRGHDAIGRFWDERVAPISSFEFVIHSSLVTDDQVANMFTLSLRFPDGNTNSMDCIAIYEVDEVGLLRYVGAYWESDV
jgi:steroid Delta-isomerase